MQIKVALVEHGYMDIVVACVKSCIQGGLAWVAAALSLELLRKGRLDVSHPLRRRFLLEGLQLRALRYDACSPPPRRGRVGKGHHVVVCSNCMRTSCWSCCANRRLIFPLLEIVVLVALVV